jgi:hypothetical protein
MTGADGRRHSAAAERNRDAILEVLQRALPPRGSALEIASGTGQHALHFAQALPGWRWRPSDPDAGARASVSAYASAAGLPNLLPVIALDVLDWPGAEWPERFHAVFCANLLHIAPWPACAALMQGAARQAPAGLLLVYGPFVIESLPTAPSNLAFDADLRARDPRWGLRRMAEVEAQARQAGWHLAERVAMPAHNQLLVFERQV